MTSSNAWAWNKKYISLNNLGSKYSLLMKFSQFMSYYKTKNFSKNFTKFQALLCLQRMKHNFYWHIKFLKQATYIWFVTANLSKFVQFSTLTSTESFLQKILWKLKGPGTSFQATFFVEFFDKKNHFVILHKLTKIHYQTAFTSKVIQ